jgi:hypothetical protein
VTAAINAMFAGIYAAFILDRVWPWGWDGRRRSIKLKAGRKDWEQ